MNLEKLSLDAELNQRAWFENAILAGDPDTKTLALIKPDNFSNLNYILNLLKSKDIRVLYLEFKHLTKLDIKALYWKHVGKDFYARNEEYLLSGESIIMALEGDDVINQWRNLMDEIRSALGPITNPYTVVHGSENREASFRELLYFFGGIPWGS